MVKKGYKQTEIGVIPEDWETSKLGNIGHFKNGINKDKDKFGYGVPIIGLMDVFGVNHINSTVNCGLVDASLYEQEDYSVMEGDVLFVRSSVKPSGVGLTAVVEQTLQNAVFSGFLLRYRTKALTTGFKRYAFYAPYFRENLIAASTVSANTNINQDSLKQLLLAYPTNEQEQNKIAQPLADMDSLIMGLEKQISKKKAIKQGAMQELLTGKHRLPGFSGEWNAETIPNVLQKQEGIKIGPFGSQLKKEYLLEDGPYRVYGQENVYAQDFSIGNRYLNREKFKQLQSCEIRSGDFLISTMGTVGKCAIVSNSIQPGIMDSHLIRLRINEKKLLPEYLLHLFSEELGYLKEQTSKLSVGGIMDGLSTKIVNALVVYYPEELNEQQAIASILSDMDDEITELEQKLAKYRQVKQGMMQQLLTGKIRLV